MPSSHSYVRQRLKDLIKHVKRVEHVKRVKRVKRGKHLPIPDTQIPSDDTVEASDQVAEQATDDTREQSNIRDEPAAPSTTLVEENPPLDPQPPEAKQESSYMTPIWTKSMIRFEKENPQLHDAMKAQIGAIRDLYVDDWDTWLNNQRKGPDRAWLRRCKVYLPQIKSVRPVALSLSNLDPHMIAPWVAAGVFLVAELCFDSIEPSARDKAMSIILKTNIIVSKWLDAEPDLRRMKARSGSSHIDNIEHQLETLYYDSLVLISSIYESGRTKGGRFVASLVSEPAEWDLKYQTLNDRNLACIELKNQVEAELKKRKDNIDVLNWIRDRKEDPEPVHQIVKERTGVDDPKSEAGKWFLETQELSEWIGQIHRKEAAKRTFWLKGPMGTGKTTLMCRVISHFEEFPISEVRFVYYYCFGSQTNTESKGPTYETVLRALCFRLAWNGDGSVAETATNLFNQSNLHLDIPLTENKIWEPLLKRLVSNSTQIIFVIDALDECRSENDSKRLLASLRGLQQESSGPYFLVSSRLHVNVEGHFEDSIQVFNCVQPQASDDITRFIKSQIDSKKTDVKWKKSIFFTDDCLRRRLEAELSKSANGMFRWVQIWLGIFFPKNTKAIQQRDFAEELLKELVEFNNFHLVSHGEDSELQDNKKMKEAYGKLWDINAGNGQYEKYQTRLFQIVMGALRGLSAQKLFEAVCFVNGFNDLERDEFEGLYHNFLKEDQKGLLDFEHISAKVFLSQMKTKGSDKLLFSERDNHYTLASIAVEVLQLPSHRIWKVANFPLIDWAIKQIADNSGLEVDSSDQNHFASYILNHWTGHFKMLRDDGEFMPGLCNFFQIVQSNLMAWMYNSPPAGTNPLHFDFDIKRSTILTRSTYRGQEIICLSPLHCVVRLGFSPFPNGILPEAGLPACFNDLKVRNLHQRTVLHTACVKGISAHVENLLKFEQEKEGSCWHLLVGEDDENRIPLDVTNRSEIVDVLLRYEPESKAPLSSDGFRTSALLDWHGEFDRRPYTPLATIIEHYTESYVENLLKIYRPGTNPLLYYYLRVATNARKTKALELLVKNYSCIGTEDRFLSSRLSHCLHIAASNGDLEIIDILIDGKAKLDTMGPYGPLICAARNLQVFNHLAARGVDTLATQDQYQTALGEAVDYRNYGMIDFLLGKKTTIYGILERTHANDTMVKYLLERDREPNANTRAHEYGKVLVIAVRAGNSRTTKVLVDHGADETMLTGLDRYRLKLWREEGLV